jgi:hypothetical protein
MADRIIVWVCLLENHSFWNYWLSYSCFDKCDFLVTIYRSYHLNPCMNEGTESFPSITFIHVWRLHSSVTITYVHVRRLHVTITCMCDNYIHMYNMCDHYICTCVTITYVHVWWLHMYMCDDYICTCVMITYVHVWRLHTYMCDHYKCICVTIICMCDEFFVLLLQQRFAGT